MERRDAFKVLGATLGAAAFARAVAPLAAWTEELPLDRYLQKHYKELSVEEMRRLLDRLEGKKLIERVRCAKDRRRVLCTISPTGLELLATLDRPMLETLRACFDSLSGEKTRELIQLLDDLREGLYSTYPHSNPATQEENHP